MGCLLALWASNLSAAQVAGLDWKSRGFTPSRALPWAVLVEKLVPDEAGYSFEGFCFRRRGRGALRSPTSPPSGDGRREGCDPLALSRGCSDGDFGFRRSRLFFCGRCFRRRERGALCSPTPPRVTGARGLRLSRALPGLDWREVWFLMEQGTVLAWRI